MNNSNKTFYPLRICTLQGRAREKYHILVYLASVHGPAVMVEGGELVRVPMFDISKTTFQIEGMPFV